VLRATAEQKPFRVARLVHARGRSKGESKQT
jgi:hypothetical protein